MMKKRFFLRPLNDKDYERELNRLIERYAWKGHDGSSKYARLKEVFRVSATPLTAFEAYTIAGIGRFHISSLIAGLERFGWVRRVGYREDRPNRKHCARSVLVFEYTTPAYATKVHLAADFLRLVDKLDIRRALKPCMTDRIAVCSPRLPSRDAKIIRERLRGQTLAKVGLANGLTPGRIHQIVKAAISPKESRAL